jgi:hypothetical protein
MFSPAVATASVAKKSVEAPALKNPRKDISDRAQSAAFVEVPSNPPTVSASGSAKDAALSNAKSTGEDVALHITWPPVGERLSGLFKQLGIQAIAYEDSAVLGDIAFEPTPRLVTHMQRSGMSNRVRWMAPDDVGVRFCDRVQLRVPALLDARWAAQKLTAAQRFTRLTQKRAVCVRAQYECDSSNRWSLRIIDVISD